MDKDRLCRVINRVNDSVFEGESIGEEACEVADQSFPAVRILGDRFRQNFFELLLKFRGELVEILHRLFGESDFVGLHFLSPKSSSIEIVSPVFICLMEALSLWRNPGRDRSSKLSNRPS